MGDPASNCKDAVIRISNIEGITVLRVSSLYRTQPVGFEEQEWFANGVIEIRTSLKPHALMGVVHRVEREMGRIRVHKWGPRIIDIDILMYGQIIMDEDGLVIPHPEYHKRRFVLVPLNEIAPCAIHPAFGISVKGLLDRLQDSHTVELNGER